MIVSRHLHFLVLMLVAAPLVAQQDELRPVIHEEVWLMKRLEAPVLGPDGRHAVVSGDSILNSVSATLVLSLRSLAPPVAFSLV